MTSSHGASRIDMFNGTYQFMSLDPNVIYGVLCNAYQDPTYLTFRVFFNFDSEMGLLADAKFKNSALAYLKRIGDSTRYAQLETAINMLKAIQESAFHCFTAISGLEAAYKRSMKEVVLNDATISLQLLESVDWRFATVNTLLKQVMYDYSRMVYVLPLNLQRFNMFVYVTEVRIFAEELKSTDSDELSTDLQQVFGISESSFSTHRTEVANIKADIDAIQRAYNRTTAQTDAYITMGTPDNIAVTINAGQYVLFNFGQCSFVPDSGTSFVKDIDNTADPVQAANNMHIAYGTCSISSAFAAMRGSDGKLVAQTQKIWNDTDTAESVEKKKESYGQQFVEIAKDSKYGKVIQQITAEVNARKGQAFKDILKNAVKQAADAALDYAKDFALATAQNAITELNMQASRLLVTKIAGNMYGLNAVEIFALTNPQFAYSRAKQLLANSLNKGGAFDESTLTHAMQQSVYEQDAQKSKPLRKINVFDDTL